MQEILDKMRQMRLNGMARAFQHTLDGGRNERYTPDEMLTHLIESEWDERHNRKLDRSLKDARFRYKASVEAINFDDNRLDKTRTLGWPPASSSSEKKTSSSPAAPGSGKALLLLPSAIRPAHRASVSSINTVPSCSQE